MSGATETEQVMAQERMTHMVRQANATKKEQADGGKLRVTEDKLKAVYALFDADETGYVLVSELNMLLRAVGVEVDTEKLDDLSRKLESERDDGRFKYSRFVQLLEEVAVPKDSNDEAIRVFNLIDEFQTGVVDMATLKSALEKADARVSEEEIREVLKYCDVDGDGKVSQEDFVKVMEFATELRL